MLLFLYFRELENINKKINLFTSQKKEVPQELIDKKQSLQIKLNLLSIQVENGQLTQVFFVLIKLFLKFF